MIVQRSHWYYKSGVGLHLLTNAVLCNVVFPPSNEFMVRHPGDEAARFVSTLIFICFNSCQPMNIQLLGSRKQTIAVVNLASCAISCCLFFASGNTAVQSVVMTTFLLFIISLGTTGAMILNGTFYEMFEDSSQTV